MQALSSEQIVQIWDMGQRQHPLDRALTCLAFALPDETLENLSLLSIGQRNAHLLILRERTFGPQLDSVATCPRCQEALEFSLTVHDLLVVEPSLDGRKELTWEQESIKLKYRVPTSFDIASTISLSNTKSARDALLEHCVLEINFDGQQVAILDLPEPIIDQITKAISGSDPQADMLLDLQCPACEEQWQEKLDIVEFLWTELSTQAQRLLLDVHQLAKAYGWHETEILGLSNFRRQYYLNQVS